MNETTVIQTTGLTRRYGRQTSVDNLNLQVRRGEVYGFLGPNGAGKTTTIRMLLGLTRPTAGTVSLFGENLSARRTALLRRIGSLVENPSCYEHLSGRDNLRVTATLLGVDDKRIDEVLEIVRLQHAAAKKVRDYSLGMKQRLGIASALLGRPELLILDEPTNGLDPSGIQEIRDLIVKMPQEHGITVLVSSHLLHEIDLMATSVGIINEGRLLFEGRIEDLRRRSSSRLVLEVDDVSRARALLQEHRIPVQPHANGLMLALSSYEQAAAVNRILVLAGHSVYRLREEGDTLEDIFLDLVGKGNSL